MQQMTSLAQKYNCICIEIETNSETIYVDENIWPTLIFFQTYRHCEFITTVRGPLDQDS